MELRRELRRTKKNLEGFINLSLMRTVTVGPIKHGTIADRGNLKRWVFNVCPGAVVYTLKLLLFQLSG